jgi:S-adenosylmethionine synthetase
MARYISKNIVAAKLARKCLVQLSYAIGHPEPVSIFVDTYGTGKISDRKIEAAIPKVFKLSPAGIIKQLDLLVPRFRDTATYGHFGRDQFSWEKIDKVKALRKELKG